jgi:hypothetical protein
MRYPLTVEIEYRLRTDGRYGYTRYGRAVNLSMTGLLLECSQELPPGVAIELTIPWPAERDNGKRALKLHAIGRSVRTEGQFTAVRMDQVDFRFDPTEAN